MTISSDNPDFGLDMAPFRLDAEALASLAALTPLWHSAVAAVLADEGDDPVVGEFAAISSELTSRIADPDWQQGWLSAWHKLHGRGFSLVDTLAFFYRIIEFCETSLLGEAAQVGRLHLELFSILRRSIYAAISGAIELGEEAGLARAGLPGELAALHCLRAAAVSGQSLAVLSLALANRNRFGQLAASDLQSLPGVVAERLRQLLRPQDRIFAGREGEWLLLLPDVHAMAQPTLAATNILRLFADPLGMLSGRRIQLEATIGAALMPEHGTDPEATLQAARLARWDLPARHENFAWFAPEMRSDWQRRFELAEELHHALQQESLQLFLQPQVDAASDECTGAELLLRWQRPDGEWVAAPQIIEMIEENGWRQQFTDWLIRSALHMAGELTAQGVDIPLSLNLTAADLLDADLPEMFSQRLRTWQMPGSRFTLELTESAMLADPERCLEIMRRLRGLGLRLALDDFGTGYSSLSYLVNLPLNEIKIDRSFIVAMTTSEEHLRVVRTIIDLAWDLEMMPLAEGVEDAVQVAQLRRLGCNRMQGYLYARPMPPAEFVAWYRAHLS